jgi:hypothetical protein
MAEVTKKRCVISCAQAEFLADVDADGGNVEMNIADVDADGGNNRRRHTEWDEYGKIKNGADRYFLSYLHHYYNVEDVINIKGDICKAGYALPYQIDFDKWAQSHARTTCSTRKRTCKTCTDAP